MTLISSLNWAVPAVDASGVANPYATGIGPEAKIVAYVHKDGDHPGDNQQIVGKIQRSLAAALDRCRPGRGDIIVVLPGHTENINDKNQLNELVAGTRVMCTGYADLRPTFTWTNKNAEWSIQKDNFWIDNAILNLAAAGEQVMQAIRIMGEGVVITNCDIRFGDSINDSVKTGIMVENMSNDFVFAGNQCYAADVSLCGNFIELRGSDRARLVGTTIQGSTDDVDSGLVEFVLPSCKQARLDSCTFVNNLNNSNGVVTASAGTTGIVVNCNFGFNDGVSVAGFEANATVHGFGNWVCPASGEEAVPRTT